MNIPNIMMIDAYDNDIVEDYPNLLLAPTGALIVMMV